MGGCVFPMIVMLLVKTVIRLVIRLMEVEEFDHPTLTIVNEDEPQVRSFIGIIFTQINSLILQFCIWLSLLSSCIADATGNNIVIPSLYLCTAC